MISVQPNDADVSAPLSRWSLCCSFLSLQAPEPAPVCFIPSSSCRGVPCVSCRVWKADRGAPQMGFSCVQWWQMPAEAQQRDVLLLSGLTLHAAAPTSRTSLSLFPFFLPAYHMCSLSLPHLLFLCFPFLEPCAHSNHLLRASHCSFLCTGKLFHCDLI